MGSEGVDHETFRIDHDGLGGLGSCLWHEPGSRL